mgnify:CR=1 FL=1
MAIGAFGNGWGGDAYGGKKQASNSNDLSKRTASMVLFVDMNSFFASCEQQVNYYLRGRPICVCVYTGRNGCVIAPSIEAKRRGIKLGMRLNEAVAICPELIPLETHPKRYREFHVRIVNVLKKYSNDVIPKSIDEAVVNLHSFSLIYKDAVEVAKQIKADIRNEVGDYLKCSIGVAPNSFLAKLASDIQKPDGLTVITPENIDEVLGKLQLTDLPGISTGMERRLNNGGILTPVQLRHTDPQILKLVCRSVVGLHWHYRLNFGEVDMATDDYKSMSAMRHLSAEQRKSTDEINEMLLSLCLRLEQRMVRRELFCKHIHFSVKYTTGASFSDDVRSSVPIQGGIEIINIIRQRIAQFEATHTNEKVINHSVSAVCVVITDFIHEQLIQYTLFENYSKNDRLRKTMYSLKDRFGQDKLMRATELRDHTVLQDVIGFGSIKDLDERDLFDDEM